MATSNQVMKKMCGGNQAQTLLEKHNALRNCFERKETLFCTFPTPVFFVLEILDHAGNECHEKSSNHNPVHQQALNFENNARRAQKSVLGAKWGLMADLSSRLSSRQIWRGFCSFSRCLKNGASAWEIVVVPESLRGEIWRNVWIPNSFRMVKTNLF